MTDTRELLIDYGDLLAFIGQSQALDARRISALGRRGHSASAREVLHDARQLREGLASVFYAVARGATPPAGFLKQLGRSILEAEAHRELIWQGSRAGEEAVAKAAWDWGRSEADLRLPLWVVAQSAADLLTSPAVSHVHECASQTCRWLFLDRSKNHSRRWCDMTICGNRMKARRFQARR